MNFKLVGYQKKMLGFCFVIFHLIGSICSQPQSLNFQHLNVEQGLSQSHINCLLKDKDGFVWIGTQDGLNRYDGYEFRNFYHDPNDSQSLGNNYIWCLLEDGENGIWIGTYGGGLCHFDIKTEKFQTYLPNNNGSQNAAQNSIRSLGKSSNDKLWVGSEEGLFLFDLNNKEFEKEMDSLRNVFSIKAINDSLSLVGTIQEIFILNTKSEHLQLAKMPYKIEGGIHAILPEEKGAIWLGTGNGLLKTKLFPDQDSLAISRHFKANDEHSNPLPSNYVATLHLDENGILWIGTNEGLAALNPRLDNNVFQQFKNVPSIKSSLSNNLIYNILEVNPNWMWVGTQEGINEFSTSPSIFQNLSFQDNNTSGCGFSAHGMKEDENGNLWVGTEKGLMRIEHFEEDPKFWKTTCFHPESLPGMQHDFIINICKGQQEDFWIGLRRGGFAKLSFSEDNLPIWEALELPTDKPISIGSNDILEDKNGDLWIASTGFGLWKWTSKTKEFKTFLANEKDSLAIAGNYIFSLFEDYQNNLWIGIANGGICKMNREDNTFICYSNESQNATSLSNNMVLSFFEDSQKRLWVCTANGLNLMESEGVFRHFFQKDGLPNDLIYGMLEDGDGNLWASTNGGLSKIRFQNEAISFQNFEQSDGLQSQEFNQFAFYKTKKGRLCFGGPGGLTIFDPKDVQPYEHRPNLVLTDFQLFNESISVVDRKNKIKFSIKKAINELTEITLRHDQNFIAFEFAALNFIQPDKNEYAYKLDGLDEKWVASGNRRYAGYPNLLPGEYTFLVKASNHDGIWQETPKSILIIVLSPPWKTWWAYLIYLSIFGLGIYGIVWFRVQSVRKLEEAKKLERAQFRKRSARDFHDEAGNKITKISLITEIAKRQTTNNQPLENLLSQIEENVQDLRTGMRDFIWVLDPTNDNLYDTMIRLKDFANGIFEYSSIHFKMIGLEEDYRDLLLNGHQRRHLILIFKEAINNCLKYSQAQNSIFEISKTKKSINFSLQDDGKGFNFEEKKSGNGLNNMQARAVKLGGKLTIHSKKEAGTNIELNLEITQMGN